MGYTKRWIPPTIPLRNDLTAWKALFSDLHDNLILAGLVQTATAGQLDISAVAALPADGAFAGFIEYGFDDALQATAPVVIKLEFGCGADGLSTIYGAGGRNTRCPLVRCTINFGGGTRASDHPQDASIIGSGAFAITSSAGISYACVNESLGFFGVVYGVGTRGFSSAGHTGNVGIYRGSSFALCVQRTVDSAGQPTVDGVYVYSPDLGTSNTNWGAGGIFDRPARSTFISNTGTGLSRNDLALRLGGNSNSLIAGVIQTQQIFAATPQLTAQPWIVSYNNADILPGTEFGLEVFPGTLSNFVAMGSETGLYIDAVTGQHSAIAMLFE